MSFSLAYDRESRILHVAVSGPVLSAEFDAALTAITTSVEFPPDVDTVWNFSDADFSDTQAADLRRMLYIRMAHAERGRSLVALVVSSNVAFGMSRMFQALSDDAMSEHLTVTRSAKEAQRWIRDARARGLR